MTLLTHLDLCHNDFTGSIPESFANLQTLTCLDLSENKLNGSIPKSFGEKMSVLAVLELSYNSFRGSISESFGNMVKLTYLSMEQNLLEGRIPKALGNMLILEHLDLTNNTLEGEIPKSIWDVCTLCELYMPSNIFNGDLPDLSLTSSSCTNHSLQKLDLHDNRIVGLVPYLSLFSALKSLDLSSNQIGGNVHPSIGQLSQLENLYISNNLLEGVISEPHFLNLSKLRNKFSNLNCLCDVKGRASLVFLDISFNQLSGTLPDCWSSLDSLAVLNLAHNYNLSGKLPTSIGSMLSIQTLHLGNNNFRGGLPSSWKNCPRLVAFDVGENNLSGSIPSWIEESLTKLSILVLRSNHFNGNIPSNICHLQSLQVLDLSMNNISGSLPTCVGNFTEIHKVGGIHATISYLIYVPIPASSATLFMRREDKIEVVCKGVMSEFGRTLGLVKSIDLSCNMLNGEIPSEITLLIGLVSLNLSRNSLSGQIPSMIGDINSLDALDLSNNHLLGQIPDQEMQFAPKKTQKAVVLQQVVGHPAQSASQKRVRLSEL
nr:receptor-like protein EIX2 [Ziziphus jujuba var. spinosa]